METIFDIVTVGCMFAIVLAYFWFAAHNLRILLRLLICGAAFAVANQAGNAGYFLIATLLILAGIAYAAIVIRHTIQHDYDDRS